MFCFFHSITILIFSFHCSLEILIFFLIGVTDPSCGPCMNCSVMPVNWILTGSYSTRSYIQIDMNVKVFKTHHQSLFLNSHSQMSAIMSLCCILVFFCVCSSNFVMSGVSIFKHENVYILKGNDSGLFSTKFYVIS